jgi:hypothetical protein
MQAHPQTHTQSSLALSPSAQVLLHKMESLPPERVAEVEDFVEFLRLRIEQAQAHAQERALTRVATRVSAPAFAAVWDSAEDEAYDAL